MILYHGSYIEVREPDIEHSRANVDFGKGFYVTPILEQAVNWANRFKRRNRSAVLSSFFFDEEASKAFHILSLDEYTEQWLDFILGCRNGNDTSSYDIVSGCVADDKVFNTVELFIDGLIGKDEAIKRLKYEKPNLQICFRTQEAIDQCLKYEGSKVL